MTDSQVPLEIDCQTVKQKLDAGEPVVLVDCREADEYATVHIPEAQLLPMSELMNAWASWSRIATRKLSFIAITAGEACAWCMAPPARFCQSPKHGGGIDRWAVEIDPSLTRY